MSKRTNVKGLMWYTLLSPLQSSLNLMSKKSVLMNTLSLSVAFHITPLLPWRLTLPVHLGLEQTEPTPACVAGMPGPTLRLHPWAYSLHTGDSEALPHICGDFQRPLPLAQQTRGGLQPWTSIWHGVSRTGLADPVSYLYMGYKQAKPKT